MTPLEKQNRELFNDNNLLKEKNQKLINSLADEMAINLNITQTVQILEILRHKQDAKLKKAKNYINTENFHSDDSDNIHALLKILEDDN